MTEGIHTVQLSDFCGLLLQVEGFAAFWAGHAVESHFSKVFPVFAFRVLVKGVGLNFVKQTSAIQKAIRIGGLVNCWGLEVRHGRMVVGRSHEDRGIGGAEVAARRKIWCAEDGWSDALDQPCVRYQVALAWKMLCHDGSNVGRIIGDSLLHSFLRLSAEQVVHGVEVVADASGMGDGAN